MKTLKVMTIFGTRPEAIKMAPLVNELKSNEKISSIVCVTAQHREMLDQVLGIFNIKPDYDLDIMKSRQSLQDITMNVLSGISEIFERERPDIILVHGDTATTFAASLAAFYKKISIGHVEAGLRTYDKYSPFPEEMNRKLTSCLADFHFCPTVSNKDNLIKEGYLEDKLFVTGNTVIDALKTTIKQEYSFCNDFLKHFNFNQKRVITVTTHRRENFGEPFDNIFSAIRLLADEFEDIEFIYPVHLNPLVREQAFSILKNHERIHLIEPLDVLDMHNLMARSYMIMTDSGGLQEEAPSLGKPVIVLRKETERPEAVLAGTVKIGGVVLNEIIDCARTLIMDEKEYLKMSKAINPYGDGFASKRIVDILLNKL